MTEAGAGETRRIGVYICHCGNNISRAVDVEAVRDWAADQLKDSGVVLARDDKFWCSGLGQERIETDIQNEHLTHVVIAACSPQLHETTFRAVARRAGLNPYLCEVVSIRERVARITGDRDEATARAKTIIAGGVERVAHNKPLESLRVSIHPDTLVVGGGITGIQAALDIASAGKKVYLVERESTIGGHMAQFDRTFPALDSAACILTPRMVSAGMHPNIELLTWSEVVDVKGCVGNFVVTIKKKPRYINAQLCTGCGECVEKCPKRVVNQSFEAGLGYRKAIYTAFPQAVPRYPVIDTENCIYFQKGTCKACKKACPTGAVDFEQRDELITVEVGNIILATGYDLFDPRRHPSYGYGRLANVFTSMEFERLSNATGPTGGNIVLRDGKTVPRTVGIVHCVGSRDRNYNNYCSSICCMQSLKFAHLVKERTGATVYEFYIDMRTPMKAYDEFYQRSLEEGVLFVRGRVAEITDAAYLSGEAGKLIIQVEDTLAGKQRRIPVDMAILSVGLQPRADARQIGQLFGISCSSDGWFIERHAKLDPVATMTEGVFVAGAAVGPKDIPASVAQGSAVAARVLQLIDRGEIELEPYRVTIDEDRCTGCRVCLSQCSYNAINFDEASAACAINPALCQNCGDCVAACPEGAINATGVRGEQILLQAAGRGPVGSQVSPVLLKGFSIFFALDEAALKQLSALAEAVELSAGQTIYAAGQPADAFYLLMEGRVEAYLPVSDPDQPRRAAERLLKVINPGEAFGLSALVEPYLHTTTTRAQSAVRLLCFDAAALHRLSEASPKLGYALLKQATKVTVERLHEARAQQAGSPSD